MAEAQVMIQVIGGIGPEWGNLWFRGTGRSGNTHFIQGSMWNSWG